MAKARHFDVQVMRIDGEGGVLRSKATLEKSGVVVDVAGPGQHSLWWREGSDGSRKR